jgi:hypothetical protein
MLVCLACPPLQHTHQPLSLCQYKCYQNINVNVKSNTKRHSQVDPTCACSHVGRRVVEGRKYPGSVVSPVHRDGISFKLLIKVKNSSLEPLIIGGEPIGVVQPAS